MNTSKSNNSINHQYNLTLKLLYLILLTLCLNLFSHNTVLAGTGINAQIPYSGTIVKNDGTVLADGGYRVKFAIYNLPSGGIAIYEEVRDGSTLYSGVVSPLLSIIDGRFEILLGSQNTTLTSINDDSLWVELQLDADGNGSYEEIFSPRKKIGSAMSAINAMRLVANGGNSNNTLSLDPTGNLIFTGDASIERLRILGTGNIGIGLTSPTARLHLPAGSATANTSPLKFTIGNNLTTPESGALEWNGTNLFLTTSGNVRQTVNQGLTAIATLNFPSTNNSAFSNLNVTVIGAALGDVVSLGIPNTSMPSANSNFVAWVSAANTVTIRFNNNSGVAQDPASGSFKIFITKF